MDKLGVIAKLFAAFPNANASELNVAVYLETLDEIPLHELSAVVDQIRREPLEFVPPVGMVMERWRQMKGIMPRVDGAARGWIAVLDALKLKPAGPLADPIAKETVRCLGGMSALRASENPGMDRAHFFRVYEELARANAAWARETDDFRQLSNGNHLLEVKDE